MSRSQTRETGPSALLSILRIEAVPSREAKASAGVASRRGDRTDAREVVVHVQDRGRGQRLDQLRLQLGRVHIDRRAIAHLAAGEIELKVPDGQAVVQSSEELRDPGSPVRRNRLREQGVEDDVILQNRAGDTRTVTPMRGTQPLLVEGLEGLDPLRAGALPISLSTPIVLKADEKLTLAVDCRDSGGRQCPPGRC
jgi:hypothetical protein